MDSEQGIRLDDLKGILQRRSRLVVTVAAACFLLAIFVASVLPNEYQAQATLLIEPQSISQKLVESNLSETDLNNRLHLISMQILSRGRLSRVIDEFDVYPELADEMTREEIIEYMRGRIKVAPVLSQLEAGTGVRSPNQEINTFQLTYRNRNRGIAAAVANRLANDFVEEHIKNRAAMSGDTSEFIEAELQRLSTRIGEVEEKMATIKSLNVGRLPEDQGINQSAYERMLQNIRDTQRELAIAQSDEAFYRQQVLAARPLGDSDESPERRIEAMHIFLNEATARGLTEKHPDVIKARQEIEQLRRTMEEQRTKQQDEEDGSSSFSFAQENARAEQQRASLRVASAQAELERLQTRIREIETRLAETPKVAEQLAALEREYQHLFQSYQQYSDKRLEARVAADMESRQKGEKFRVLEAAFAGAQPASPNRPVILALGLVLGVMAGAGLGVLAEVTDLSFHDSRSLQSRLGIPVLAAVPPVLLESDRALKRSRRVRNILGSAIVTSAVLVASVAGNWIVNGPPGPLARLLSQGAAASSAQVPPAPPGGGE